MLTTLFGSGTAAVFCGCLAAYALVAILLHSCARFLPRDAGRQYAHDGTLSVGKPRGAGILFVLAFAVAVALFLPFEVENAIYLFLLIAAMMTGYLDDGARTPWGEYKKGLLDLAIAVLTAVTYLNFNGSALTLELASRTVTLPPVVYGLLTVVLVWASINVTNCTDGVDGLSATVSMETLLTFFAVMLLRGTGGGFAMTVPLFCACLAAYLWYNAHPSRLLMGDAGSRAMGLFIAIAAIKCGSPLLYLPAAAVLILDGGLGLIKVSLLRFCHIHILTHVRTPLHDHMRKNHGWSDEQTVTRFAILQLLGCLAALYLVLR